MDAAYRRTADNLPTNKSVHIERAHGRHELVLSGLDKLDEPPSLLALKTLVAQSPAPVTRQESRWYATPVPYVPDREKVAHLTQVRYAEQARMQEYMRNQECLMLFLARETNEYTGRAGVIDMVRRFNLTTEQALEVSDHLPIWAEFSIYEGGNRGRVAKLPTPSTRPP